MAVMETAEFEPLHPQDAIPDLDLSGNDAFVNKGEEPFNSQPPAPPVPEAIASGVKATQEAEDTLEVILPSAEPRIQEIKTLDGKVAARYTQKPLSYLRKMQFFRLVARTIKEAIDESGAEAVAELFGGGVANLGALTSQDVDDAGSFMKLIASVVELAEDFIEDAYVIWLGVKPGEREWAKAAMRGDIDGIEPLSDEDGVLIIETFVVQNWGAMQRFFREDARRVFEVARAEQRRLNQPEG